MEMIDKKQAYQILSKYYHHTSALQHKALKEALDRVPVVDAAPIKYGKWIYHVDDLFPVESTQECSLCHHEQPLNMLDENYCPNCGARMEENGKND